MCFGPIPKFTKFIDFTRSNGSYLDGGIATYERKTDGTRNPAYELCLFNLPIPLTRQAMPSRSISPEMR
jgi:hypothetical protein